MSLFDLTQDPIFLGAVMSAAVISIEAVIIRNYYGGNYYKAMGLFGYMFHIMKKEVKEYG